MRSSARMRLCFETYAPQNHGMQSYKSLLNRMRDGALCARRVRTRSRPFPGSKESNKRASWPTFAACFTILAAMGGKSRARGKSRESTNDHKQPMSVAELLCPLAEECYKSNRGIEHGAGAGVFDRRRRIICRRSPRRGNGEPMDGADDGSNPKVQARTFSATRIRGQSAAPAAAHPPWYQPRRGGTAQGGWGRCRGAVCGG